MFANPLKFLTLDMLLTKTQGTHKRFPMQPRLLLQACSVASTATNLPFDVSTNARLTRMCHKPVRQFLLRILRQNKELTVLVDSMLASGPRTS